MRIDQYLWCIRVFKSRSLATKACKKGWVRINDQVVKSSREVIPTDAVSVKKEQIWMTLTVLDLPKSRVGAKLVGLYRMDTTPANAHEVNEMQKLAATALRDRGTGRPTKKDRRDIEDLSASEEDAEE